MLNARLRQAVTHELMRQEESLKYFSFFIMITSSEKQNDAETSFAHYMYMFVID